jgi:CheY-like chemotaxis protein
MVKVCLIAEHDPWDIQLLRLHAEGLGLDVVQAFETQDVIPIAKQVHPDVILLETELPGTIECPEVLRRLRSDPAVDKIAVVLISWSDQDPVSSGDAGGLECMKKPVTCEGLRTCLERAGVW